MTNGKQKSLIAFWRGKSYKSTQCWRVVRRTLKRMDREALRDTWYLREASWCIHYLKGFTGLDQGSNIPFLTKANWHLEKTKTGQAQGYMLLMYSTSPTYLQLNRLMNFQMNDFSTPSSKNFKLSFHAMTLCSTVHQFVSAFLRLSSNS